MASLRDRAEALLEDVGLEGSGKLADDVRAVAEAVGVNYTTVGETVAACERETTSTVLGTVTPRESLSGAALETQTSQSALAAAAPMPAAPEVKSEPTSLNFGLPSNGPGAQIFWDLASGSPSAPTAAAQLRSMVAALYPGENNRYPTPYAEVLIQDKHEPPPTAKLLCCTLPAHEPTRPS